MDTRIIPQAVLIAAGCALCMGAGSGGLLADDKDNVVKVRILTPRIKDEGKVEEIAKALQKLPSVRIVPHSDATPHFLIEFDTTKVELGELAKTIAAVKPAVKKEETAAFLMAYGKFGKEGGDRVLKALANVTGVDAKKSEVGGERLIIALDNDGGAKLSEVLDAVKSAVPKK